MTLTFKQGDTHNAIVSVLEKKEGNGEFVPIKLNDCKVYISVSGRVEKDECTILDAESGKVSYLISNISDKSGFYNYEFIVSYSDGTEEIIPNQSYKKVRIYNNLEGEI